MQSRGISSPSDDTTIIIINIIRKESPRANLQKYNKHTALQEISQSSLEICPPLLLFCAKKPNKMCFFYIPGKPNPG